MKTLLCISLLMVLSSIKLNAQSNSENWEYIIPATPYDDVIYSRPHNSGVFISTEKDFNITSYMLDPNGKLLWSDIYDRGQAEYIVDVKVDPLSNNVFVLINTQALNSINLGQDFIVLKYSPNGVLLNTLINNHNDSPYANENDEAADMAIDDNGDIYVLFLHSHGDCNTHDRRVLVEKFNSSLISQWTYSTDHSMMEPRSICLNASNKLFFSYRLGGVAKITCLNSVTGNLIQDVQIDQLGNDLSSPFKLCPDKFGNVYGLSQYNIYMPRPYPNVVTPKIIKIDKNNEVAWEDTLKNNDYYSIYSNDLAVDNDGNIFFSYNENSFPRTGNIIKIDSSGTKKWRKSNVDEICFDLEITDKNEIILATSKDSIAGVFSKLRKYSTYGNENWHPQAYISQQVTEPTGQIAVSQNGDVYLTGDSGTEIFTIAYIGGALGFQTLSQNINLLIYPNPCQSNLHVSLNQVNSGRSMALIQNTLGEIVLKKELTNDNEQIIDLSKLPVGYYVISIINEQGVISKQSFIHN